MTVLRARPYGDAALLVEVTDAAAALALRRAVAAAPPAGLVDLVPAARTLLVRVRPGTDLRAVAAAVRRSVPGPPSTADAGGADVEIPVVYDGEDLDDVARLTGLTTREVVATHTARTWTVAFAGFAPGFGYLESSATSTDARLTVPRRAEPRTVVPAGAVALAGEYCGVYPRSSPGGWQLLGRTDRPMWLPDRDPPAVLVPGVVVRFTERAS